MLIGKSGVGKSTVAEQLCMDHELTQLWSYTTRSPRYPGEKNHKFLDPESYSNYDDIRSQYPNRVAETVFSGNFYFATEEDANAADLYVIDVPGVLFFQEHYQGPKGNKIIYLTCSEATLFERMLKRGDHIQQVVDRVWHDKIAFADASQMADLIVCNHNIKTTSTIIWNYIKQEEGM